MSLDKTNEKFLEGDVVYLRKPNIETDVIEGEWHAWFNNYEITKYLVHGVFPISREQEVDYVKDQLGSSSTLLLSIIQKKTNQHIGIISLKSIDLLNRTAEIAIIMGAERVLGAPLEAMSLMTEHAFERLNLNKLYAGQHEDLWSWVNSLELIGYKIEGYRRQSGIRALPYDIVLTGITAEDFFQLKKQRGGKILPASSKDLYKQRRKENLLPKVKDFFENLHSKEE